MTITRHRGSVKSNPDPELEEKQKAWLRDIDKEITSGCRGINGRKQQNTVDNAYI